MITYISNGNDYEISIYIRLSKFLLDHTEFSDQDMSTIKRKLNSNPRVKKGMKKFRHQEM
jgi:hypothetical protein